MATRNRKTAKRAQKRSHKKIPTNQLTAVEMRNLTSEFIRDVSYSEGELTVEFRNGAVYVYTDVDSATVQDFLAADSFGQFFNEHIRHYNYERIN